MNPSNCSTKFTVPLRPPVPAKHAIKWLAFAWQQFKTFPGSWIILSIVYGIIGLILGQTIFSLALLPVFNMGLFLAAAAGDKNDRPKLRHLFSIFMHSYTPWLILIAIVWFAFMLAFLFLCIAILILLEPQFVYLSGYIDQLFALSSQDSHWLLFLLLFFTAGELFTYFSLAYGLVPCLIMFNHLPVLTAFRVAFFTNLRNWRAIIFYIVVWNSVGLLYLLVSSCFIRPEIGRYLTQGSLILLFPLFTLSHYYMWKDVFSPLTLTISELKSS